MILCDWCHSTEDVLQGIRFEMAPMEDGGKEAILLSYDLCMRCRQDAAEAIRQALFELIKVVKKTAQIPIPEK